METEKNWFVDIDGTVYEASTETIDQWIWDGTMLAKHRVSREGARWLEVGRAPQFATHFVNAEAMNDILANEGIGVRPAPVRASEDSVFLSSSVATKAPQPFGIRLLAGWAIALLIALVAGYFWSYQISSPLDMAVINNSPEMNSLQAKYDDDKARIEEKVSSLRAQADPVRLTGGSPKRTREIVEIYKKIQATNTPDRIVPLINSSVAADITALNNQFEADKKMLVAEMRGADKRSRFYQVFVLLFLGIAGLNLARLSLFSKK